MKQPGSVLEVAREVLASHVRGSERDEGVLAEHVADGPGGPRRAVRRIHHRRRALRDPDIDGEPVRLRHRVRHARELAGEQRTRAGCRRAQRAGELGASRESRSPPRPAWIVPTVTTPGSAGSRRRDTIVCSAPMSSAAPTTGSRASCGRAAVGASAVEHDREGVGGRGKRPFAARPPGRPRTAGRRARRRSRARRPARRSRASRARPCRSPPPVAAPRARRPRPGPGAQEGRSPTAHDACTSCPHACITPGDRGGERETGGLGDGQRVDVAAQRDRRRAAARGRGTRATRPVLRHAVDVGDAELHAVAPLEPLVRVRSRARTARDGGAGRAAARRAGAASPANSAERGPRSRPSARVRSSRDSEVVHAIRRRRRRRSPAGRAARAPCRRSIVHSGVTMSRAQ